MRLPVLALCSMWVVVVPNISAAAVIAKWSFDGNGKDSQGKYDVKVDKATFQEGVHGGESVRCDGNSFVGRTQSDSDFSFGQRSFTIETWVMFDKLAGEQCV